MRLMLSCLLAVSAAGLAARLPAESASPAEQVFTLAVMRRDGVLVPFAQYDNGRWRNPWPTPFTKTDVPISLWSVPKHWWGKVPPGTPWTFWPATAAARPVAIAAPVLYNSHCVTGIGLRTDYRSSEPVPPPIVHHHPKDGLAVAGGLQIEAIEILRSEMPEWKSAVKMVQPYADAIEEKGERAWAWSGTGSYFNRKRRSQVPLALEVLCRTPGLSPSTFVYYFETLRRYPAPARVGPRAKEFLAFAQGFALPGVPPSALPAFWFTGSYEDPVDADFLLPLGAFRLGQKLYWAVQWSGQGREQYAVIEIGDRRVRQVISTAGGGC